MGSYQFYEFQAIDQAPRRSRPERVEKDLFEGGDQLQEHDQCLQLWRLPRGQP